MTTATLERSIALQVAHNVRHIGGYATRDGRRTRPDIIRSASLHRLEDPASLAALGVRTIVDLRSSKECGDYATPDVGHLGIRREHAPVFEADGSPQGLAEDFQGYAPVYRYLLDTGQAAYRRLFLALAGCDDGFLFHCAAGKDRTGVAAALMLDLAGVSDDDIVHDYSVSAALLAPALREWEEREESREADARISPELRRRLMGSEPEDMYATLSYVRSRWGSAEGYLAAAGIDDATRARLRARLVTREPSLVAN